VTYTSTDPNLVANPSFEISGSPIPSDWTLITYNGNSPVWDTVSHSGVRSIRVQVTGSIDQISGYPQSDLIQVEPLQDYHFSAWGKTENAGGTNAPAVRVVELDANQNWIRQTTIEFSKGTNDWVQNQVDFQTASNTGYIYVYANIWNSYGTFWVDDVELSLKAASTPTPVPTPTPTPTDITPPSIVINSPADGQTFTTSTIIVNGIASDNVGINKVEIRTGSETWQDASGTSSWSATVTPVSGPNTIYARATDTSGNVKETLVVVTYTSTDPNLVANPSFEISGSPIPSDWTLITYNGNSPIWDTVSHSGVRSIRVQVTGSIDQISGYPQSDLIQVEPLQDYHFSAWGKTENAGGTNAPAVRVVELDANQNWIRQTTIEFSKGTNDWVQNQVDFQTASNTGYIYVYANIWNSYGTFWVDDVELSLKAASTPTPTPTPTTGVEIGNFNYFSYYSNANDPRLTFDCFTNLGDIRPGTTTVWQIYKQPFDLTDLALVQSRFDLATANQAYDWDYGAFVLNEEVFNPILWAIWTPSSRGLSTWNIDGSKTLAGVEIQLIKPWYISQYGTWNQGWWDGVVASNNYNDPIVKAWNADFTYDIYRAWHLHMRSLGKKSAIIGIVGVRDSNWNSAFENYYFPSPSWEYVTANYDLLFTYMYPKTYAENLKSKEVVSELRSQYNYQGKIAHILTTKFSDGLGTTDQAIAQDEFNQVYPYVDYIISYPYMDVSDWSNPTTAYSPVLIGFQESHI